MEGLRVSVSLARESESLEEREVRFNVNWANASRIRQTGAPAQTEKRLAADRAQLAHRDSSVDLGAFNKVCTHCNAVTWKDESKGIRVATFI